MSSMIAIPSDWSNSFTSYSICVYLQVFTIKQALHCLKVGYMYKQIDNCLKSIDPAY